MDTYKYKEKILKEKLELLKWKKLKDDALTKQIFNEAAKFRDEETVAKNTLNATKEEILSEIRNFSLDKGKLDYYLQLNELLLEFHPIEFQNDRFLIPSTVAIEESVRDYWKTRNNIYRNFQQFIENEYHTLMDQRRKLIEEKKMAEAELILKKIFGLGEFLYRFRR